MAISYNESKARSLIKSVLESVNNVGKVHDYERYADDWDSLISLFVATIEGSEEMRGWTISLSDVRQEQESFGTFGGDNTLEVTYTYRIRGFMAVSDSDASEKTFAALVLAIMSALNASASLHSSVRDNGSGGEFYGPPCQARFDFRMFGDVLCHYAELVQEVKEVL